MGSGDEVTFDAQYANSRSALGAALQGARGRLPLRYARYWEAFYEQVDAVLLPGARILDVGSGASPVVAPEHRPKRTGLDIFGEELEKAPAGSYDERVVSSVTDHVSDLDESFDAVLSLRCSNI